MIVQSRESIREEFQQCLDVLKYYRVNFPETVPKVDNIEEFLVALCEEDSEEYEEFQNDTVEYIFRKLTFDSFYLTEAFDYEDYKAFHETFKMYDFKCSRRIKNLIYSYINTDCELFNLPIRVTILEIFTMMVELEPFVEFSKKAMEGSGPVVNLKFVKEREIIMLRERHIKKISDSMLSSITEGQFKMGELTLKFSNFQITRDIPVAILVDSFFNSRRGFGDTSEFTLEIEGEMTDSLVSVFFSYICRGEVEKDIMKLTEEEKEMLQVMADRYQLTALNEILELVNSNDSWISLPLEGLEREDIYVIDDVYVIKVIDTINKCVAHFWCRKKGDKYMNNSLNHYIMVGDMFSDFEVETDLNYVDPCDDDRVRETNIYKNIKKFERKYSMIPSGFFNINSKSSKFIIKSPWLTGDESDSSDEEDESGDEVESLNDESGDEVESLNDESDSD